MDGMDELIGEFLIESHENLDALDRHLVELEEQPTNQELLASIFRTIHTIKGTCGFLGFNRLESVTHVGENLLSRLREGEIRLNPDVTSGCSRWWMRYARCCPSSRRTTTTATASIPS
jgi:two-component system chemotaxis sensor kinase CheA